MFVCWLFSGGFPALILYRVFGVFDCDYFPFVGFTGFAVRGAFGVALRDLACVRGGETSCRGCEYRLSCVYYLLFELRSVDFPGVRFARRGAARGVARPYVVLPVRCCGRDLEFGVVIIAPKYLEYEFMFISSFLKMGFLGLGVDPVRHVRRRFRVVEVVREDPLSGLRQVVYSDEDGYVPQPLPDCVKVNLLDRVSADSLLDLRPRFVEVRFLTPTQVRYGGVVVEEFPLVAIVMNLARRYSLLAVFHGVGDPIPTDVARELRDWVRDRVKLVFSRFRRVGLRKFSLKTRQVRDLGSFVLGRFVYEFDPEFWSRRDLAELAMKLLLVGQYVGVGQLASAGCGQYVLSVPFRFVRE